MPRMEASAHADVGKFYVASRATVKHKLMWQRLRREGWQINATWIDEPSATAASWDRAAHEIRASRKLVLYAEDGDEEPMKGALVEAGMALAYGKPVVLCVSSINQVGTWVCHPRVFRASTIEDALAWSEY